MKRAEAQAERTDVLLTPAEVAGMLKVSLPTVYRWIRSGTLPSLRVGRGRRIRESALHAFLQQDATPPQELQKTAAFLDQLKAFRKRLQRKHGTINTLDVLYEIREQQ